jgi:hypothetical protein
MSRLLTEHKVCEKEIENLRGVVLELIASGNAAIKGDYSDWDSVVPKAEALLKPVSTLGDAVAKARGSSLPPIQMQGYA